MASNYAIDPADGVEPVPSLGIDINLSENIIIDAKKKALEEAKKYRAGRVITLFG